MGALPWRDSVPYLLITKAGQAIRFVPDDVRPMGRTAAGVRGVKLAAGDTVIGAMVATDDDQMILIHDKGAAKRVACAEFPLQSRAGKGVRCTVVATRHGSVGVAASLASGTRRLARSAGVWAVVDLSAAVLVARDAAPAKIRGFDGRIDAII